MPRSRNATVHELAKAISITHPDYAYCAESFQTVIRRLLYMLGLFFNSPMLWLYRNSVLRT